MAEIVYAGYEVTSQNSGHWPVPYARMSDVTPTPTNPARVTATLAAAEVCGTVLSIDANVSMAVVDFSPAMVYLHNVRNVTTYALGAESAWAAINIGDVIYYDPSGTMPAGVKLSTSPLDEDDDANPVFGRAVAANPTDAALYPLGGITASTQTCAVMQVGVGGS